MKSQNQRHEEKMKRELTDREDWYSGDASSRSSELQRDPSVVSRYEMDKSAGEENLGFGLSSREK